MELELLILFLMHTVGASIFGRFEVETAWWRLSLKWLMVLGIAYVLNINFGQAVSLSFLGILFLAGLSFHFIWCKRNGIHPLHATPRKKYYQLRKWNWEE
ncbi:MAG TPA: hypothetical protein PKC24_16225 [Cyclobacteriaceae bacterium]|nr:hypothetical protein [Cyclobacteriaceae bacterium]